MPYKSNADLPESITKHLPDHAQSIFRKAFNSAHEQYGEEERAFKVAWAAVKKEYEKNDDGMWVRKD
jgi:cation transport regulator